MGEYEKRDRLENLELLPVYKKKKIRETVLACRHGTGLAGRRVVIHKIAVIILVTRE